MCKRSGGADVVDVEYEMAASAFNVTLPVSTERDK